MYITGVFIIYIHAGLYQYKIHIVARHGQTLSARASNYGKLIGANGLTRKETHEGSVG